MADRIVIDTGPLIALARIDALDLPGRLPIEFVCPVEVREELDAGERAGYGRVAPGWLSVVPLNRPLSRMEASTLGKGEAAVIALAAELGIETVCIDEWKGRRSALAAGLNVTGALGLLGRAKRLGLVQAIGPYVDRAVREGIRYDESLIRRVLESVGEA